PAGLSGATSACPRPAAARRVSRRSPRRALGASYGSARGLSTPADHFEQVFEDEERGACGRDEERWENEERQREEHLDGELPGRFLRSLPALHAHQIRVRAEGLAHARAEPVALDDQGRSEEHTSELQSRGHLVCRLLL